MLLRSCDMPEQLYNPINHLSQTELMEKFNLAFYEAQNLSKTDILSTFNETILENIESDVDETSDDYLIDYLISNPNDTPATTPSSEIDVNFDFNDFVVDFDQNVNSVDDELNQTVENFDTETFTTEETDASCENCKEQNCSNTFSQFFVPPPFAVDDSCEKTATKAEESEPLENMYFNNLDLYEELTSDSLHLENLNVTSGFQRLEDNSCGYDIHTLPPVGTITRNNVDFNNFLRNVPANDISYFSQDTSSKNEFGHLIGTKCLNNNFVTDLNAALEDDQSNVIRLFQSSESNQMVLSQREALLNDDPLLSSSSIMYPTKTEYNNFSEGYDCEITTDSDEVTSSTNYQCKWEKCFHTYESQTGLVKHIEKCHVELKRGDEFTCFWEKCPRKTKPFNARYKLLIHMRVHSGEKPNKCPYKGCNKAFSRLENLKIHQRSHTGERPYLCQFSSCTKSFSNSSDRAKHQRTHFDTKPYACQVLGCMKKYTDPSSLRKHVKNHTHEEQMQIKKKSNEDSTNFTVQSLTKKYLDPNKQRAIKLESHIYSTNFEHNYSNTLLMVKKYDSLNIKQDLKNKISEKNKLRKLSCC